MSGKIVITKINFNQTDLLLCGLLEETRLIEARLDSLPADNDMSPDSAIPERILGNIYIGKVQRVVSNLSAAFVEIAPGFPCYLSLEHIADPVMVKSSVPGRIVQDDEIVVQVCREAMGGKAPALTTNLNFSGRYAVLTTGKQKLGLSSKLDGGTREHDRLLLKDAVPAGCGLIVRTNARAASDEELLAEIDLLRGRMEDVLAHARSRTCYSCLYRPDPMYLSYLQGVYTEGLTEIVTDLSTVYEGLRSYCENYRDLAHIPLHFYEDAQFPLASLYNLNREMVRATAREVRLKSGGFLVIEPTEAMTVIDVNTGKSTSAKNREEHFVQINLEASREIALQLRLRNLSGIVIVDFIDLEKEGQKKELLEDLRRHVQADPVPVQVHDITALNLVEITRKKVEKSLSEQIKQLTMKNPL